MKIWTTLEIQKWLAINEATLPSEAIDQDQQRKWILKADHDKVIEELRDRILSLYDTADHLSHEDERNSCAHLLKDLFNVQIEEGIFGGAFLKETKP